MSRDKEQQRTDRHQGDSRSQQQRGGYDAQYINDERRRGIYNRQNVQNRVDEYAERRRHRDYSPIYQDDYDDDSYESSYRSDYSRPYGDQSQNFGGEDWNQTDRSMGASRTRGRHRSGRDASDSYQGSPWLNQSYRDENWPEDRAHQRRTSYGSPHEAPSTWRSSESERNSSNWEDATEQSGRYGGRYSELYNRPEGSFGASQSSRYGSAPRAGRYNAPSEMNRYYAPTGYGPHAGKGPKGYRRSDDQICEEANQVLERHGHVDASEVEVSCTSGILTLRGKVEDRRAKREAEESVQEIYGVDDVMNELKVEKGFLGKLFSSDDDKSASKTNRKTL